MLSALERIRLRLGKLPVRVRAYLSREAVEPLLELGVKRGFGDEYLKIMGVKLFTDGSLGARTAWLSEPYEDDPSTAGIPVISEEELRELVRKISGAGLQLAIHAIGDRANDMVLKVYSELGREAVRGLRHRIEHASILRPDQLRLMAELGAAAAVQPHFIISDWWVVRRLGRRRASWAYPLRTIATMGIPMGFSTDAPVEPLDPWETVYAAVTRGEHEGVELAAETPGEKLGLEESLHSYTMGSAYLLFEEEVLGSLEPGKLADYIVVDRDPLGAEPSELRNIKVLETVVGGETVYRAGS